MARHSVSFSLFWLAFAATANSALEYPEIRDTAYSIPSAAYFVAVTGSDGNAGNAAAPFRTLSRAIEAASSGATIVLRQGTYRESVPLVSKRLTIQPYPREQVWLKGSIVVSDWIRSGTVWRADNWTHEFDRNSYERGSIDSQHPYAGYPDMVYVDGQPLAQVGKLADVGPGRFFVDYRNDKLYIGTDPKGSLVEASAFRQAVRVSADGTVIRGLGFMHYAGGRLDGMLQFDSSDNVTIENNTFALAASRGLAMYRGDGATVRGNTFLNNGQMGYGAWRYDNVRIEGNRFAGNNQERFVLHGPVAEAAGAKLTVGKNWVIRDNVFENNQATGLWLDISNYNAIIVNNRVVDNLSYGIYYEISGKAIIASNLVVGNRSGIRVSNSSDVRIYNNTLARNFENFSIQDDNRRNFDPDELKLGITYITANVELRNNILSNGDLSQNPFIWARDFSSTPLKAAEQMISVCDSNAYYRTNSNSPAILIRWWSDDRESTFRHVDEFRKATGCENNGIVVDDVAINPFFVDETGGDYRLKSASIALRAGASLPHDIADAIGVTAGVPVDLGALGVEPLRGCNGLCKSVRRRPEPNVYE